MAADERVWTMIYRGDIGLRAARRGLVPEDRMPEVLRQRMAERTDSQWVFDAGRRVVVGAGGFVAAAWEWVADAFRADVLVNGGRK
jgi:hypothetical protein